MQNVEFIITDDYSSDEEVRIAHEELRSKGYKLTQKARLELSKEAWVDNVDHFKQNEYVLLDGVTRSIEAKVYDLDDDKIIFYLKQAT